MTVAILAQPVLAEAPAAGDPSPAPKKATAVPTPQLQGDARILHALNRFTFGPRPGDVDAVRRIGLDRWFDAQLDSALIDDSRLDARLDEYPAIRLSAAELQQRYPNGLQIKQIENGRRDLPRDARQRTLVQDQMALYDLRRQNAARSKQDAAIAAMTPADTAMQPNAAAPATAVAPAMTQAGAAQGAMAPPAPRQPFPRAELDRILALDPGARVEAILAMPPEDLVRLRGALGAGRAEQLTAGMTPQQKETLLALGGSIRMIGLETMNARVMRDLYSDRQLEAVMTDFWLNHFNVYLRKNQNEAYLIPEFERTVRANALGNFETLLVATAKSPAMLEYLDNFRSIGPDSQAAARVKRVQQMNPDGKLAKAAAAGLNENYGRELMELHTLGVNGGYTQTDVTQVAKVFTGWTIDRPYGAGKGDGGFTFDERRHEPGPKTVLGATIEEDGEKEGLQVLHMLAASPATAHFLAEKLAIRFVSDTPPPALVDRMAQSYLASHGDIKTVLRTLFHAPEFWSPVVYRAKVKTPEEFVFSAVRASAPAIGNPTALVQSLEKLGMPLYGMPTPNGYSWKQDEWVSTGALVTRMNFALVMSGDRLPGVQTEWTSLLGTGAPGVRPVSYVAEDTDLAGRERRLETALLGEPVSERTRAAVLGQAGDATVTEQAATQFDLATVGGRKGAARRPASMAGAPGVPDDPQAAVMAGLLLGSPEFQRR